MDQTFSIHRSSSMMAMTAIFDYRAIYILRSHHIKPFILKVGNSGNDQTNHNCPNLNLQGLCGQARMNLQRHHRTLEFTTSHMNYVLVETWRVFQISSAPFIINAFNKTKLVLLTPPDENTNTQACLTASQIPKGKNRRGLKC